MHGSGFSCTGTISDLDGSPRATWTYDQDRRTITRDRPMDQDSFRLLCNGIDKYKVFKKYSVRDLDAEIDPANFHFVSFTTIQDGQPKIRCFMIPTGEHDGEFARWLQALNRPPGR
jgi:hypothetical protein